MPSWEEARRGVETVCEVRVSSIPSDGFDFFVVKRTGLWFHEHSGLFSRLALFSPRANKLQGPGEAVVLFKCGHHHAFRYAASVPLSALALSLAWDPSTDLQGFPQQSWTPHILLQDPKLLHPPSATHSPQPRQHSCPLT